jgi:hypothetical protein
LIICIDYIIRKYTNYTNHYHLLNHSLNHLPQMNTIAKFTLLVSIALFATFTVGEPNTFEPNTFEPNTFDPNAFEPNTFDPNTFDPNNDVACVCVDDNKVVTEYGIAFKVLKDSTTRFANHMSDSRFNYTTTNYSYINTMEFKNYFTNVNESLYIMNNTLNKLQNEFDAFAKNNYDWMLVIAGYVIKREYDSIINMF